MLLAALLLLAPGQFTEYTLRPQWEAATGSVQTADFQGFASGTTITDQYAALGMTFTQGDEYVRISANYSRDNHGIDGNGDVEISFSSPQNAIGCDFPGGMQLDLYSGPNLIYSSNVFGGVGIIGFAGIVAQQNFDRVVISDWTDSFAHLDDVSIGAGFLLAQTGVCPGPVTLDTFGGTPNGTVAILYGLPGSTTKLSGVCAGTVVSLYSPRLGFLIPSNGSGAASFSFNSPGAACGRILQAVDLSTCRTSNTLVL